MLSGRAAHACGRCNDTTHDREACSTELVDEGPSGGASPAEVCSTVVAAVGGWLAVVERHLARIAVVERHTEGLTRRGAVAAVIRLEKLG